LEQAAQGSGGVTIPGGVQKTCKFGTSGHGFVGMVVLGGWLDLMIQEVFSNLNDSMIKWDIINAGRSTYIQELYFCTFLYIACNPEMNR